MSEGKLIFFTNDTYPHANLWMRSTGGHSFHVLVSFFFLFIIFLIQVYKNIFFILKLNFLILYFIFIEF